MENNENQRTTDFGYQEVPWEAKAAKVKAVFSSVASHYDIMNDLMSLGIHRYWKRYALSLSGVRAGNKVLDIAGGTGDLSRQFADKVGVSGEVLLADINAAMLAEGRNRCLNEGYAAIQFIQANAEALPFPDNYFDCISIAFGLRNVTDKDAAIRSMYRCLKPGGRLLILEFSKPIAAIKPLYDLYSFSVLPTLGAWIANDADSYRYLAESIRKHPDQPTLQKAVLAGGFDECDYHNLTGGIVALHRGFKY